MAYLPPPRWSHGGVNVSAARMNILSDDETDLNSRLGGDEHHAVGKFELPPTPVVLVEPVAFVHLWRWLWYMTIVGETATISDPSGANPDTTLPDSDTVMVVYDLADVSWLTQGQVYELTGCQYGCEDWSA